MQLFNTTPSKYFYYTTHPYTSGSTSCKIFKTAFLDINAIYTVAVVSYLYCVAIAAYRNCI